MPDACRAFRLLQRFLCSSGLGWVLWLGPTAWAQPAQAEAAPEFISVEPATEAFRQQIDEFRCFLKQLIEVDVRFHNADDPAQRAQLRQQWYTLRDQGHEHYLAMLHAGLEEFLDNPQNNPPLADFLFSAFRQATEQGIYEGMLPIGRALLDHHYPAPELIGMFAICCLANNEFELARQTYQQLLDRGAASSEMVELFSELDALADAWQREQQARQRDAAGEPLPLAKVSTTKGSFVIELFENQAPQAVANFIALAEQGFYDYNDFYLVAENAFAQAGCPLGDGSGGPGYFIPGEGQREDARSIFRGSVSLALLPDLPDSGGSQFLISYLPLRSLAERTTVFGRVISGMHNVARLNRIDPKEKKPEGEPPAVADEIISVEILRKRDHDYQPTRLSRPTAVAAH